MAHTDSDPPAERSGDEAQAEGLGRGSGADDNASGVGALVALAEAVAHDTAASRCDTWFVATGAEERGYTGQADHLGARALARRLTRTGRSREVRFALSLDEVGRGSRFWLRSPTASPRQGVERSLLTAARATGTRVRWVRDTGTGNSDHRELALAGMPAMKLGVPDDPLRHTAADTADRVQRAAFTRVLRVLDRLLG